MKRKILLAILTCALVGNLTACSSVNGTTTGITPGDKSVAEEPFPVNVDNSEVQTTASEVLTSEVLTSEDSSSNSLDGSLDSKVTYQSLVDKYGVGITLKDYLDARVSITQPASSEAEKVIFIQRGYNANKKLVYELCDSYYFDPEIRFNDDFGNIILIDDIGCDVYDAFKDVDLSAITLFMNDKGLIESIYSTNDGSDKIYSITYSNDGKISMIKKSMVDRDVNQWFVYRFMDNNYLEISLIPYEEYLTDVQSNATSAWYFDADGLLDQDVHIEGSGIGAYITNSIGDDGLPCITQVRIPADPTYEDEKDVIYE